MNSKKPGQNFFIFSSNLSWILDLGVSIADFGLGDPGSNLGGSKFFPIFFHIFGFLKNYGKRWYNANFKMWSTISVRDQKVEKIQNLRIRWKKKKFADYRIRTGVLKNQSQPTYPLSHGLSLTVMNFHFVCHVSWE